MTNVIYGIVIVVSKITFNRALLKQHNDGSFENQVFLEGII